MGVADKEALYEMCSIFTSTFYLYAKRRRSNFTLWMVTQLSRVRIKAKVRVLVRIRVRFKVRGRVRLALETS